MPSPPLPGSGSGTLAPRAAVIVPVFNGERFVRATLDSVRAQSVRALEIVVVDDGSTDSTQRLLREMAAEDPRVVVLAQDNAGVAAARNRGAAATTAPILAFCDADDWWDPVFLERCFERLVREGDDVGLVYAWTMHHHQDGTPSGSLSVSMHEGDVRRAIVLENFLASGSACVVRRGVFERAGGFETRFFRERAQGCED